MPAQVTVVVDLNQIKDNTEILAARMPGIEIVGVTKATCGSPQVARAMLDGGATAIGESRLENIARLREAGIDAPMWLLRSPTLGQADLTVELVDVSLISEYDTAKALNRACKRQERRHSIMAMVDLGDLREGMLPADLPGFLEQASALSNIDVVGIGTSLTCFAGVVPDEKNLGELAELAAAAEKQLDKKLIVSGGNSSSIDAAAAGVMPEAINNLRIGESIILGVNTLTRLPLPSLYIEAVEVQVPVIEVKKKPSVPRGEIAQDAFGGHVEFKDRGDVYRAVCAVGRQDVDPEGLLAIDRRITVVGGSSDMMIVDVDVLPRTPVVGEYIPFTPNYSAMLRLFTSPYVIKEYKGGPAAE
jgi:ornithine racemase